MAASRRHRRRRNPAPTEERIDVGNLALLLAVDARDDVEDCVADLEQQWAADPEADAPFLACSEDDILAYLTTWMDARRNVAGTDHNSRAEMVATRGIYEWWRRHQ